MPTVGEIFDFLNTKAPVETKLDFDNVGLLVGSRAWPVTSVLLALEITGEVIAEAKELKAGLVLSHHPLFFDLKAVSSEVPQGKKAMDLLTGGIAAICMHTNLDAVDGGVNDALASALGLGEARPYEAEHICRLGTLPEAMPLADFLARIKKRLGCAGLRYVDGGRPVCLVAVGGGSCGSMLEETAETGCDTFVTADVKHDQFLRAKELGLNLIDAGHFNTENVVIPVLRDWLAGKFPALELRIAAHGQPEKYFV
jgi:dinuclear metal center YbgI/SA1388 family protein